MKKETDDKSNIKTKNGNTKYNQNKWLGNF